MTEEVPDPSARAQQGGSADTPQWSVNDHWVLRAYAEDNPQETVRVVDYFVQAIDALESQGAEMDAYRIVSDEGNHTAWYRMSDLALMKERLVNESDTIETVYPRPCPLYRWPLDVGATWDSDCLRSGPEGESSFRFNASVESQEGLAVPSGNFTVYRILFTGEDGGAIFERTEYFAPAACFLARDVNTLPNGTVLVQDLVTYECEASR